MDEVSRHNSSCIIELVSRTLQEAGQNLRVWEHQHREVFEIAEARGDPKPKSLALLAARPKPAQLGGTKADNTVREAKNQYVLTWLHLAVAKYHLKCATLCHLRKSHTHCRIGCLAVCVVSPDPAETSCGGSSPEELATSRIFKTLLM